MLPRRSMEALFLRYSHQKAASAAVDSSDPTGGSAGIFRGPSVAKAVIDPLLQYVSPLR